MKQDKILIGLTGQTGAGKSAASDYIRKCGYPVIDADLVSRKVMAKGSRCTLELIRAFGGEILCDDGSLNRKLLGKIVFSDPGKKDELNRITHPYILKEIFAQADGFFAGGARAVFLDAPTLFESGADKRCDYIISIIADEEIRAARIMARDNITPKDAAARINAQYSDNFYSDRSDYVIVNDKDLAALSIKIEEALKSLGLLQVP